MNFLQDQMVDCHVHVGLLGDRWPQWGHFSEWYKNQVVYKVFLFFSRIDEAEACDSLLRQATLEAIFNCRLDKLVCLALDPVYTSQGERREDLSHVWVDNDYVLSLQQELTDRILLGASVHPYDPEFKNRVKKYIDQGAVLLKWLPSAQQINLADIRVRDALIFLAEARDKKPLPLLLHIGPEYAIPSADTRTSSYDYLSWSEWDNLRNWFRGHKKWHRPQTDQIQANLKAGLDCGAVVIFGHCGLPYYAPNPLQRILEHSDFDIVRRYLEEYPAASAPGGRCFADVSACVTPFRKSYFPALRKLPQRSLLLGSDFPTPVFEISADAGEMMRDFKAVLKGHLDRIVVPQDNLMDVNLRELKRAFPRHPMFTNFSALLMQGSSSKAKPSQKPGQTS